MLLLLARDPARAWTPAEVAAELRTTDLSVTQRLPLLQDGGLIAADGHGWRFAGDPEELARVERCYRAYRVALIEAIFAVDEDAAPDAVSSFADAFRLRKDSS